MLVEMCYFLIEKKQCLYRKVHLGAASRFLKTLGEDTAKRVLITEGTENWFTSDLVSFMVKHHPNLLPLTGKVSQRSNCNGFDITCFNFYQVKLSGIAIN